MKDAPTNTALAKQLNVPRQRVALWRKRDDWRWSSAPWSAAQVAAIDRWRKTELQEDRSELDRPGVADAAARSRVKMQREAEQALTLRRKREILEGLYIKRDTSDRALVGLVQLFRTKIEDWIESLPPLFEGKKAAEMRLLLQGAYDRMCADLHDQTMMELAESEQVAELKNVAKARAAQAKHRLA